MSVRGFIFLKNQDVIDKSWKAFYIGLEFDLLDVKYVLLL